MVNTSDISCRKKNSVMKVIDVLDAGIGQMNTFYTITEAEEAKSCAAQKTPQQQKRKLDSCYDLGVKLYLSFLAKSEHQLTKFTSFLLPILKQLRPIFTLYLLPMIIHLITISTTFQNFCSSHMTPAKQIDNKFLKRIKGMKIQTNNLIVEAQQDILTQAHCQVIKCLMDLTKDILLVFLKNLELLENITRRKNPPNGSRIKPRNLAHLEEKRTSIQKTNADELYQKTLPDCYDNVMGFISEQNKNIADIKDMVRTSRYPDEKKNTMMEVILLLEAGMKQIETIYTVQEKDDFIEENSETDDQKFSQQQTVFKTSTLYPSLTSFEDETIFQGNVIPLAGDETPTANYAGTKGANHRKTDVEKNKARRRIFGDKRIPKTEFEEAVLGAGVMRDRNPDRWFDHSKHPIAERGNDDALDLAFISGVRDTSYKKDTENTVPTWNTRTVDNSLLASRSESKLDEREEIPDEPVSMMSIGSVYEREHMNIMPALCEDELMSRMNFRQQYEEDASSTSRIRPWCDDDPVSLMSIASTYENEPSNMRNVRQEYEDEPVSMMSIAPPYEGDPHVYDDNLVSMMSIRSDSDNEIQPASMDKGGPYSKYRENNLPGDTSSSDETRSSSSSINSPVISSENKGPAASSSVNSSSSSYSPVKVSTWSPPASSSSYSYYPGPLTKSGCPDMRYKVNKERYGSTSTVSGWSSSYSDCPGPMTKFGRPDMRYKANKEIYGSTSTGSGWSSSSCPGPLKKSGRPDMRYKVNKEIYGSTSTSSGWSSSYSDCPGPLTKSGRPDMRYKANKERYGSTYSAGASYTSYCPGPRTKSGRPDMRYKVNKQYFGK